MKRFISLALMISLLMLSAVVYAVPVRGNSVSAGDTLYPFKPAVVEIAGNVTHGYLFAGEEVYVPAYIAVSVLGGDALKVETKYPTIADADGIRYVPFVSTAAALGYKVTRDTAEEAKKDAQLSKLMKLPFRLSALLLKNVVLRVSK